MSEYEVRAAAGAELRFTTEQGKPAIDARAIMFDSWSVDLGGFRERMMPGSVQLEDDLLALFDHDSSMVLGRKSAGTMQVAEDAAGVTFTAFPPDTQWARDLRVSMERGDIRGCSYRMIVDNDKWYVGADGTVCRDVIAARVSELTVTSMPAYPSTTAEARSRAGAVRATAFPDTLADADASRAASWSRFWQLEAALESTISDSFDAGDLAAAATACDDFSGSAKAWITAASARMGLSTGYELYSARARVRAIAAELRDGRVLSAANEQTLKDAVEALEQATENIEAVLALVDPTYVDDDDEDTDTDLPDAEGGSSSRGRSQGGSPIRRIPAEFAGKPTHP